MDLVQDHHRSPFCSNDVDKTHAGFSLVLGVSLVQSLVKSPLRGVSEIAHRAHDLLSAFLNHLDGLALRLYRIASICELLTGSIWFNYLPSSPDIISHHTPPLGMTSSSEASLPTTQNGQCDGAPGPKANTEPHSVKGLYTLLGLLNDLTLPLH